ncbi:glutamate ABC transporter substrate-binding protein [Gordonia sp. (in: high G+C Gram-positive bacteria)]|jgi:polar amino acid transport system substrate-binding protein|uniref:glutamate ABC transporter substrate-binding protein n=1 Tax=Gordonia sp. (in: high G+C Gram-positive bacteria) TaxID=84139 RepID=UPI0026262164|nr:glutamate ABC transporter substrate-binding protein [Gordonia sp. (in: high G+C Gram-positive bacteria)]HMS76162.1 glutamate ABC transporter substrate-binding protein [Gordonia sp. (in: high G+C Gram-positive bacteria)]
MTARRPAATILAAMVLAALTMTGCTEFPAPDSPPPSATADIPAPPGAMPQTTVEPVPDAGDCDALTSLRPGQLPTPRHMPARSTMAAIFSRGRLIVGLDIGSNLFSFRDTITGDIKGFDVDIARAIARAVFGDPNQIEFRVLTSGDRIKYLQKGDVDVVVKTMSITCDRRQAVSFSAPYYVAAQRILAQRNSGIADAGDLAGKRVCAARGVTSIGRLQSIVPTAHITTTSTWADCLVMLQQGQVDAVSTDDAILAGLAEQDPWVRVIGPSLGEENYAVGIAKGHDDLVRFVNGVLDDVRTSGQWQQMYNRWLSILGPGSPPIPRYQD